MKNRIGEKNINNFGSEMIIVNYKNRKDMDVYFPKYNWIRKKVQYDSFKNGKVKCIYERSIYGIGYIGEGNYKTYIKYKQTAQYATWTSMLQRCYNEKNFKKYPTYIDCSVAEEWHNFQNFAEWYDENYYEIPGQKMHLDKDILVKGNKIYSPDTCVFVPQNINILFAKSNKSRGDLPIGVCYDKQRDKYRASCGNGTSRKSLGYYNTPEEAFEAYKNYKEKVINEVAKKYKNQIPNKLYQALLNYEVEITD